MMAARTVKKAAVTEGRVIPPKKVDVTAAKARKSTAGSAPAATSMRVSRPNLAVLSEIAKANRVSLDEALRILIFEWRTWQQIDDLRADPEAHQAYLDEAQELAEVDVAVVD
jgi:hypothetical protein